MHRLKGVVLNPPQSQSDIAPILAEAKPLGARLFTLAWPIVGLNVLQVLALAVDTAMCGRLDNAEEALAALGFSTQVIFLLMVAMIGLTVGNVALVSRAFGAEASERVNHVLRQSTMLAMALALGVAGLGNLLAEPLLILLGASDQSLVLGLDYLRPMLGFCLFAYLGILYSATLRGVGNTRLAFEAALFMNALNVALNYGLILGNYGLPALGVAGAAYGTVTSQCLGVLYLVLRINLGALSGLTIRLIPTRLDSGVVNELWRVGWPAALDMIILNVGFMAVVGFVGWYDEVAVAAHGVGLRIQALAFVPGMAVSQAAGAMIGNALGASDRDEAKALVRLSIIICGGLMSTLGILFIGLRGPLLNVFDIAPGSPLADYTTTWVVILGAGMPLVGVWIALSGVFSGAGNTTISLRINTWTTLLVQIPLCWVLGYPLGLGPLGVWLGFPLSFLAKALAGYRALSTGDWARTGLHATAPQPRGRED